MDVINALMSAGEGNPYFSILVLVLAITETIWTAYTGRLTLALIMVAITLDCGIDAFQMISFCATVICIGSICAVFKGHRYKKDWAIILSILVAAIAADKYHTTADLLWLVVLDMMEATSLFLFLKYKYKDKDKEEPLAEADVEAQTDIGIKEEELGEQKEEQE